MYIDLLFREVLSASGLMTVSVSSWDTLMKSATTLPSCITLPSPFALLPLGFTNTMLQNCSMGPRQLRGLKLNGEYAPAQFHWVAGYGIFPTGIIILQLGL